MLWESCEKNEYRQSQIEHITKECKVPILIVYADDIILTGDDSAELET